MFSTYSKNSSSEDSSAPDETPLSSPNDSMLISSAETSDTASETTEYVPDIASETPLSSLLPSQPQKTVRTNEESNKHDVALMCFIKYYSSAMVYLDSQPISSMTSI